MKKTKNYVAPEVQVVKMDTTPLLAGSDVKASAEKGQWSGLPAEE